MLPSSSFRDQSGSSILHRIRKPGPQSYQCLLWWIWWPVAVVEAGNNTDRHNDDTWSAIDNRLLTTTPRIRAESLTRIDTDRTDMSRTVILLMQNFEPSHMTSVLPGLSRRRPPSSQSLTSAIHFESLSMAIWLSHTGMDAYTWQSSAYWCRVTPCLATTSCNSVVYSTTSSGPRTDPCGTPYSTGRMGDSWPMYATCCVLPVRNDVNHSRAVFSGPNFYCSRISNSEWSTQPKAVVMSSEASNVTLCLSASDSASDITRSMAVSVEWWLRYADWLRGNRSLLARYSCNCWAPIVNVGGDSCWKWPDFQLWRACNLDLDLGSGHTAYHRASLIDLYLHAKFHWNERNFVDRRTYARTYAWHGWTDGHLTPALLGRCCRRVDLKRRSYCLETSATLCQFFFAAAICITWKGRISVPRSSFCNKPAVVNNDFTQCRHLVNLTKHSCLVSDWCRHMANSTKCRAWLWPIGPIMWKLDIIHKTCCQRRTKPPVT